VRRHRRATLVGFSHVSMYYRRFVRLADRFHQLRDFVCEHPDGNLILAAIDDSREVAGRPPGFLIAGAT
jgi:hypothetical protein